MRCHAPPTVKRDCRSRLFLSQVLEQCDTESEFALQSGWRAPPRRDNQASGAAEVAGGRRRLLFRGWDDCLYRELSPASRLLLRERVPALSLQIISTRREKIQVARFKALGRHCASYWNLSSQPETLKTYNEMLVPLGILGHESSGEKDSAQ